MHEKRKKNAVGVGGDGGDDGGDGDCGGVGGVSVVTSLQCSRRFNERLQQRKKAGSQEGNKRRS